jgi:hypothetical protein
MISRVLDLNAPIGDDVWLFHGTSAAAAASIIASGWHPPDPRQAVEEYATKHGVKPAVLSPEFVELGKERHSRSAASCATGWRLAAGYARRGPEYLYFARSALAKKRSGRDDRIEPQPLAERAAIFLMRIPWNLLEELQPRQQRDQLLPDSARWDELSLWDRVRRVSSEVVVPGSLLVEYLVGVDWIRTDCDCSGSYDLKLDAENQLPDNRLRCERCFIAEEPILRSSPGLATAITAIMSDDKREPRRSAT